jgi:carbamoyltransferase
MTDGEIYILGIHDGHNCGATLSRGGAIVASVSEERLVRRKNAIGYPRRAIEEVLRIGRVEPRQLSDVVYASLFMHTASHLDDISRWYPVGMEEQIADARTPPEYGRSIFETRKRERIAQVVDHLGVAEDRVSFVEHHLAHLAAAYFTAPRAEFDRPVLGLTCDGAGDGLCATVSICRGNAIERIAKTDRNASVGKIYSRVTYLMGMTPWEHEYKLMGLAPYADPQRAEDAAKPLHHLLGLTDDGLGFALKTELSTNYCYRYLRDALERVRFDTIAGATQRFTEDMLIRWVRGCIAKTGIGDIVCGGGVFMNVKANMLIAELPEVRSMYVMPSASDESLSIGACLHRYYAIKPGEDSRASRLTHLYLGGRDEPSAESAAVEEVRRSLQLGVAQPADMNTAIADLLGAGEIVAVCRGPMEWGARALGNRSILSSAHDYRRVDRINQMIKMRDFWMPFAPSIKSEAAGRYFEGAKGIDYSFMTFAAPVRPAAFDEIIAGSHPKDRTIRPQVVTKAANPDYHAVIGHFERLTGRGAVLNTSFNLHGEPIVATGRDAIRVMAASDIQHLALNDHLLSKRP